MFFWTITKISLNDNAIFHSAHDTMPLIIFQPPTTILCYDKDIEVLAGRRQVPSARTSFLCYNNPESPPGSDGYAQVRGFLFYAIL